jgi:hypothetical protein
MRSPSSFSPTVSFTQDAIEQGLASQADLLQVARQQPKRSLQREAFEKALIHKWNEGVRLGRDPGHAALKEWFQRHWLPFCRQARLDHVQGLQRWEEYGEDEFGRVLEALVAGDILCDRILDRMEHGKDNFEIINWALDWGLDTGRVLDVLLMIDINQARLEPSATV